MRLIEKFYGELGFLGLFAERRFISLVVEIRLAIIEVEVLRVFAKFMLVIKLV